jgi:hypothetical protein
MLIEHVAGKKPGSAHMCKQLGDDIGILDEVRKDVRCLNARKQFAQRQRQRGWTAWISLQRHLLDEIGHHNAGRLVDIQDLGAIPASAAMRIDAYWCGLRSGLGCPSIRNKYRRSPTSIR